MLKESLWNTVNDFSSSKSLDDLWIKFREKLSVYGVTSVFYGVTDSPADLFKHGAEDRMFYTTDHPEQYRDYFDDTFNMDDDITAVHCLLNESPFIWHRDDEIYIPNKKQRKFLDESTEFGMGVGVTVPLRFGMGGSGGVGICNAGMSARDFELMWAEHGETIVELCNLFDESARGCCTKDVFSLSHREIEVLRWLGDGKKNKAIAHQLGTASSTVEKQAREARRKLRSLNDAQAVLKAYKLGLITP